MKTEAIKLSRGDAIMKERAFPQQALSSLPSGMPLSLGLMATSSWEMRHIVQTDGVRGGKPRIRGHRITVQDIIVWYQKGYTTEEIIQKFDLTRSQLQEAWTYYALHQQQMDKDIEEEDREIQTRAENDTSAIKQRILLAIAEQKKKT